MIVKVDLSSARSTTWTEYATRFVFGGAVALLAGVIADKFGPVVGGLFLAFPAIFPAGASLIEKHQQEKKRGVGLNGKMRGRLAAGVDAAGAAIGCSGLLVFAVVAWKLLPQLAWGKRSYWRRRSGLSSLSSCGSSTNAGVDKAPFHRSGRSSGAVLVRACPHKPQVQEPATATAKGGPFVSATPN